ncbi:DUF4286 family protein [Jiella pelagia]|uniref:Uncharacterized protein n=1 Tax=Jiella pelagia TaxID=2986949 RepID=A0ABY7C7F3_9HYPH|nr:DUF4286 family protein [Jiella pelagia]WAP69740.1 hypothetical protein OH818_05935 [Jiella pelagia]
MALSGTAAVVIWNDVTPEARADFLAWHNREHIPERVSVAGFRRGRRGRAVSGGPEFFTLYEVDGPAFFGGDYRARLDDPTPWTRRVMPQFRNASRALCRVEFSLGAGIGGYLATAALPDLPAPGMALSGAVEGAAEVLFAEAPGLVGLHLLRCDAAGSREKTAEHGLRREASGLPAGFLLVEGTDANPLADIVAGFAGMMAARTGARFEAERIAIYRHELCLGAGEMLPPLNGASTPAPRSPAEAAG